MFYSDIYTRKMVPITRRASSFVVFFFVCTYVKRLEVSKTKLERRKRRKQKQQEYQFTTRL